MEDNSEWKTLCDKNIIIAGINNLLQGFFENNEIIPE